MSVKDVLGDNKKFLLLVGLLVLVCLLVVYAISSGWYGGGVDIGRNSYSRAQDVMEEDIDYQVSIKTIYGDIVVDLYSEVAPENVNSLLFLAGKDYYDGLTFHKVINSFVIQAGDTTGDGNSDPGYTVPLENESSAFKEYSVGMANASQFFIVLPGAEMSNFNGQYTLIGEVIQGFDVVNSIAKVEVDDNNKPINDVEISNILILEN